MKSGAELKELDQMKNVNMNPTEHDESSAVANGSMAVILRSRTAAENFAVDAIQNISDLSYVWIEELSESLGDHLVELTCGDAITSSSGGFDGRDFIERVQLQEWTTQQAVSLNSSGSCSSGPAVTVVSGESLEPTSKRTFKMRVEHLEEVLVARLVLSPWVVDWSDHDFSYRHNGGLRAGGRDQVVEFEVSADSPSLDDLRWLLNQIQGLQVAGQSLNYEALYRGTRLDPRLLARLRPSQNVLATMAEYQEWVADQHGNIGELLEEVRATLNGEAEQHKAS